MTPNTEDVKHPTRDKWPQFAEELRNQFGVIDKKGEARNRVKNIIQGKRTICNDPLFSGVILAAGNHFVR